LNPKKEKILDEVQIYCKEFMFVPKCIQKRKIRNFYGFFLFSNSLNLDQLFRKEFQKIEKEKKECEISFKKEVSIFKANRCVFIQLAFWRWRSMFELSSKRRRGL